MLERPDEDDGSAGAHDDPRGVGDRQDVRGGEKRAACRHHHGSRRHGASRTPRVHGRAHDELHCGEGIEVKRGHRRHFDSRRREARHEVLREDRGRDAVEVRHDVDEREHAPDENAAGAEREGDRSHLLDPFSTFSAAGAVVPMLV